MFGDADVRARALSRSALSELLDAIRAGGNADVMRDAMTLVLQQLVELEADQAIGAGRYERTDDDRPPGVLSGAHDTVAEDHNGSLNSTTPRGTALTGIAKASARANWSMLPAAPCLVPDP